MIGIATGPMMGLSLKFRETDHRELIAVFTALFAGRGIRSQPYRLVSAAVDLSTRHYLVCRSALD